MNHTQTKWSRCFLFHRCFVVRLVSSTFLMHLSVSLSRCLAFKINTALWKAPLRSLRREISNWLGSCLTCLTLYLTFKITSLRRKASFLKESGFGKIRVSQKQNWTIPLCKLFNFCIFYYCVLYSIIYILILFYFFSFIKNEVN